MVVVEVLWQETTLMGIVADVVGASKDCPQLELIPHEALQRAVD